MASSNLNSSNSANPHYENIVEAQVTADAFHARLFRTRWRSSAMAAFSPPLPFIEMALGSTGLVSASYSPKPAPEELIRLGDVTFIPKDAMLHYRTRPGSQRTISCMFDIDRLAARAGMSWEWPEFDKDQALDMGNDYIRTGLRRVAEELVSPGFASINQIECSLLFIATEILRVFHGNPPPEPSATARFGRRELSQLCEMVIDPNGEVRGLSELASELGMCSRTLATTFRRTTGKTFRSFLAGARVEKAKILLADRHLLIKQVAYDCGFRSCASFSAAFRKATGLTPESYRSALGA